MSKPMKCDFCKQPILGAASPSTRFYTLHHTKECVEGLEASLREKRRSTMKSLHVSDEDAERLLRESDERWDREHDAHVDEQGVRYWTKKPSFNREQA